MTEPSSWFYNGFFKSNLIDNSRERKQILLWTNYFSLSKNWLPSTHELQCPVPECDVTSDRDLLPNSSAIIMHWRNVDEADLPPECPDDSDSSSNSCPVLVMFNKEAPPNTGAGNVRKINNRIHVMATYRRDSDIYAPYGKIAWRSDSFKLPKLDPNRGTVCWLVSHCTTQSNREVYVNNLKLHVNVTIYGKCGSESCPHTDVRACYEWLAQRCKFYLSFENSICKDYSTEKLYYAMMTDMVPVVMGGDDYSRYLPSHSFINIDDFASSEQLGAYLKALDKDEAKYLEYFKWKERFKATFVPYQWLCDVCALLHSAKVKDLKPRQDMISWWFKEAQCGVGSF
ncbi:hypothetical protein JTE90_028497 [Oedothorax gibbosus]|uniref:Fucosyltransferase n=1 Tax=Oedothorax gibbosus TaxID=931172 RepID=A0AAV6VX66_9ARAC|nr:hypothetical protein JTE90_028497 [Oedothorax gibbosus]